jgi:hypothetical protein
LRALADIETQGQVALHSFQERDAPFTVAGLTKPIERAGFASAAIELHRRQLASPAHCGRLLAQTNTPSLAYTDPPPTLAGREVISRIKPQPRVPSSNSRQQLGIDRTVMGVQTWFSQG